jgi:UDP-3-O-[3-hydroxymyristoyl] glucosamine N-acyltransferase
MGVRKEEAMKPPCLFAVSLLVPALCFAGDKSEKKDFNSLHCNIEVRGNDRVAKGKDVIVEENAQVHDAVAVEGNVVLKKGARVHSAVALHGSVTVESGAQVAESAVAVGGKVMLAPGASVHGNVIFIDNGFHLRGEDGKTTDLDVTIGGFNPAKLLLEEALKEIRGCVIADTRT